MLKNMKIGTKLALIFGSIFLIFLIGSGVINYLSTTDIIEKMVSNEIANISTSILTTLRMSVDNSIKNYLRAIAEKNRDIVQYYYNEYKNGNVDEKEAKALATKVLLSQKIGKSGYIYCLASNGVLKVHPKKALINVDISSYDFAQKQKKDRVGYIEYMWKNPDEEYERPKALYMTYFEPWDWIISASSYREEFNELVDLQSIRNEILSIKIGETGYPFVMDTKGNLIIHPKLEGKNIYDEQDESGNYFIREICNKKNGIIKYPWKNPDETKARMKIVYYKYLQEMDWIVCVGAYEEDIRQPLYNQRNNNIIIVVLSLIIIVPVILLTGNLMVKPILNLSSLIKSLSQGDLTKKLSVLSNDELGILAKGFNEFVTDLNNKMLTIRKSSDSINRAVQDLSVSSKEIASTSNQQAAAVKEVVTTMEDSNQLLAGISAKATEVRNNAFQTKELVEQGSTIIHSNLDKMNEIRQKNADTITGIKSLSDKINSIWEIVNIINNIADQTKIIAFNAELEAATAGEAGKNFKIVANEIRRLANNTVASTKEIKSNIDEIQRSSDNLIVTSEQGTEKINEGWELSNKVGAVFEEIMIASNNSVKSVELISSSIEQQNEAFNQIFLTLKQISEGIDNFVVSTKSMSNSSESLKEIANSLKLIIEKYNLKEEVS